MNSTNATLDYLSWVPKPSSPSKDQAARALIFLTFAMVTAFLFSLLISKFQQQLRKHVQRVHGLQNA